MATRLLPLSFLVSLAACGSDPAKPFPPEVADIRGHGLHCEVPESVRLPGKTWTLDIAPAPGSSEIVAREYKSNDPANGYPPTDNSFRCGPGDATVILLCNEPSAGVFAIGLRRIAKTTAGYEYQWGSTPNTEPAFSSQMPCVFADGKDGGAP